MGDAVAAAPAPAPVTNGGGKPQTPVPPPPTPKDVASGPQTSDGGRGPDGKFTSKNGEPAAPPVDEDPELDFGEGMKLRRSAAAREIQRARQSGKALTDAQKRIASVEAKEKAEAERKERVSKGDVAALFEGYGLTPEQEETALAKFLYERHIEPRQMTEEQRAARAHQQRAEAAEAKLKAIEEERTAGESKRVATEQAKALETELIEAAKAGRIPGGRAAVRRIAAKMEAFESKGLNLPIEQVAALVREDVGRETGEFAASATVEDLKELWGEPAFKAHARRMRDYLLSQLKPGPTGQVTQQKRPTAPQRTGQHMTPQQFLESMRRK